MNANTNAEPMQIARLACRLGDTVVVKVAKPLTKEQGEQLRASVMKHVPFGVDVMVVGPGVTLEVMAMTTFAEELDTLIDYWHQAKATPLEEITVALRDALANVKDREDDDPNDEQD